MDKSYSDFSDKLKASIKDIVERFKAVRFFQDEENNLIFVFKNPSESISKTIEAVYDDNEDGSLAWITEDEIFEECAILDKDRLLILDYNKLPAYTEESEEVREALCYLEKYEAEITWADEFNLDYLIPPSMYDAKFNRCIKPIKELFERVGILDEWRKKNREEMNKLSKKEEKKSDAVKILEKFDSIMIIPIESDEPVLIFKMLGKPFYHEQREIGVQYDDFVEEVIFDYRVYWKGKLGYNYPKIIKLQYGDIFWELLNARSIYYKIEDLPEGVIELPLKIVLDGKRIKIFSPEFITPVRNILRRLGIIKETRGKYKKRGKIILLRDKFMVNEYKRIIKETKRKKPLPIKILQRRWTEELIRIFPDNPEGADKYGVSDATVRRVLKKCIKK